MSNRTQWGANERGMRSSALWGTAGRGGESRSSVLWGKGGRGIVAACLAVCALAAPLAAVAAPGGTPAGPATAPGTYVAKELLAAAKRSPEEKVRVIVQSTSGSEDAEQALKGLGPLSKPDLRLEIVGGVAAELPAKLVEKLAAVPGLTVTPDATVRAAGGTLKSNQLWPYESGNDKLWPGDSLTYVGKLPTIAIIDSGVQANRLDFDGRVLASVNLCTLKNNSKGGDGRGHGTFVAGIAAGGLNGYPGAAPSAPLVSVDVMDDQGVARTSDVISGVAWVLQNRAKYNIRVANLSLHSVTPSNFTKDPLDMAVEQLWFAGVTVVAAAGNYGTANGPSGVKYAPGNDPFVITVGAADLVDSHVIRDDTVAPWSAYGYTYDGFYKPEVAAAGRYMIGPVPSTSTLATQRADHLVAPDRIQLSGTSFAAPVVAGTAAQILARHPLWGPDQVKGALMATARPLANNSRAAGMGEITATRAAVMTSPPNPNHALEKYLSSTTMYGTSFTYFNALAWTDAAKTTSAWDSLAWTDLAWTDLAWTDLAWTDLAWTDVSTTDLAWSDMAWTDLAREDVAEGDQLISSPGYVTTQTDLDDANADTLLQLPAGAQ
jgi:serine protease AprX